ncbi:MAG: cyclic nucleotide-binding domain-containing protein [Gammaproteobacteria bacterium]|nr:hypothetical protein [Gammaproteobacteria bacterium]NIN62514.1 hypothetical protein [Gammaproteobacteria bacterium]NIO63078.1 hypothetical protein [Gammaproteobacteria bacterium]NIP48455.1 cyclic nucleotide-binding domain-containing protein [Gammaproteobacteria bacterium]NIQ08489.1 cyclic nucleotide-binding domain-containing protein [Gammaproteobacteria bacterium]
MRFYGYALHKTFLREVEHFTDLDETELDQIVALINVTKYSDDAVVYEENTPRHYLSIIQEGEIQLSKKDSFGNEKNLVVWCRTLWHDPVGETRRLPVSCASVKCQVS